MNKIYKEMTDAGVDLRLEVQELTDTRGVMILDGDYKGQSFGVIYTRAFLSNELLKLYADKGLEIFKKDILPEQEKKALEDIYEEFKSKI